MNHLPEFILNIKKDLFRNFQLLLKSIYFIKHYQKQITVFWKQFMQPYMSIPQMTTSHKPSMTLVCNITVHAKKGAANSTIHSHITAHKAYATLLCGVTIYVKYAAIYSTVVVSVAKWGVCIRNQSYMVCASPYLS